MDEFATRLASCFALVFPGMTPDQVRAATPQSVAAWDSLAHLTLLTVVDEEFGISTDVEDAEHLASFEALLDHVRDRRPVT